MGNLLFAFCYLIEEGLFTYLRYGCHRTVEAYVLTEVPGIERETFVVFPRRKIVAKIKLIGWSALTNYPHIVEREILIDGRHPS